MIPQPSVERLLEMGAWLDVNGETIYGTKSGPIQGVEWRRSTAKPGKVYVHVLDWPEGGEISMSGVNATDANLLADAEQSPLAIRQAGENVVISGPAEAPDAVAAVAVLDA